MSNYNSKHTGAQIDEAVSKVLNGEVGGGGGAAATPDWHASDGEPGHIVGRTHFIDYPLCILNKENTSSWVGTFDVVYVAYNDNIEKLENGKSISLSGDLVRLEYNDNTVSLVESEPGLIDVVINYDIRIFGVINKLNDLFIPDTVIKTTPQSLSDANKNQALTNLGIDPVVWKYMLNPYQIFLSNSTSGADEIPEDLAEVISKNIDYSRLTVSLCISGDRYFGNAICNSKWLMFNIPDLDEIIYIEFNGKNVFTPTI